jgi:hypothetical protein
VVPSNFRTQLIKWKFITAPRGLVAGFKNCKGPVYRKSSKPKKPVQFSV